MKTPYDLHYIAAIMHLSQSGNCLKTDMAAVCQLKAEIIDRYAYSRFCFVFCSQLCRAVTDDGRYLRSRIVTGATFDKNFKRVFHGGKRLSFLTG